MINGKVKMAIFNHAKEVYPNECVGVVMQKSRVQKYYPLTNISDNPTQHGEPDHQEYHDAISEENGVMIAFVHSHPGDGATTLPSNHDRAMCNEFGVPFVIVSIPEGDMRILEPDNPPLIGRPWALGSYDCWGLVMAFHALHGVKLPDYRSNKMWWKEGGNLFQDNMENEGFVRVDAPPSFGDTIIMQLSAPVWNHSGIYVGNNQILHHYTDRVSRRDIYSGWYTDKTVAIFRHKDLPHDISQDY